MKISKKFIERVGSTLKNYQQVATAHRIRDVSEADTVTVVKDVLADIFGYNKYVELTSEHQIRGTYCDLAIKIDNKIRVLIEVKAAAIDLSDHHIRQAVNYGAHQGIEWVALTNGLDWRLYKIKFEQPIDHEEVVRFKLDEVNSRNEDDLEKLFLLAREGMVADAITNFYQQSQLINKYTIAQILQSEQIIKIIRRDIRKLFPDINVEVSQISDLLTNDILKREVLEGEKVKEAQVRLKKAMQKMAKILSAENNTAPDNPILDNPDKQAA